jgi:hypothetical protein
MAHIPDNPYPNERDLTEYLLSRRQARWIIIVFSALMVLPPLGWMVYQLTTGKSQQIFLVRLLSWTPARGPLLDHLHASERSLTSAPYAKALQQHTQELFSSSGLEGNRKTYLGYDGWLFYQPEFAALSGYGPLREEPRSPMKDPSIGKLRQAKDVVLEFHEQLKERGIKLMLVPVPVKATIYPEGITGSIPRESEAPVFHPDEGQLHLDLQEAGIDVLDITPALLQLKKRERPVYLKQDTHWTFDTMQIMAKALAVHIRKHHPSLAENEPEDMITPRAITARSPGDLVKLLDLPPGSDLFSQEQQTYVSVPEMQPDAQSEVVLMGDSFVNIYHDPALGFAPPGSTAKMHAGFAQYLALYLGRPLDVIAINGGGATDVRRSLARRPDDEVRAKKLVVWVLSARDLLLTPAAARDAGVTWQKVEFTKRRNPPKPIEPLLRQP